MDNKPIVVTIQVDPLRAGQVLDARGIIDMLNIRGMNKPTLEERAKKNPDWAPFFWYEGPDIRSSCGQILALQAHLGRKHFEQTFGVAA